MSKRRQQMHGKTFRKGAWAPDQHNKHVALRKRMRNLRKSAKAAGASLRKFGAAVARFGVSFEALRYSAARMSRP